MKLYTLTVHSFYLLTKLKNEKGRDRQERKRMSQGIMEERENEGRRELMKIMKRRSDGSKGERTEREKKR